MKKQSITIRRLSSFTLLKIMLITGLFPWILVDTAIILYHLINGDFVITYYQSGTAKQMSIGLYIIISYPLFVFIGIVFTLLLWLPCAFSLWLWSKLRTLRISFYDLDNEEL